MENNNQTLFSYLLSQDNIDSELHGTYYCSYCSAPRLTTICRKCKQKNITPVLGWINPKMPDLSLIIHIGKTCGYTIAVHGSLEADLDLVAVPWISEHGSKEILLKCLCEALNARIIDQGEKPLSRYAYNLQIDGYYKIIDLSIVELR